MVKYCRRSSYSEFTRLAEALSFQNTNCIALEYEEIAHIVILLLCAPQKLSRTYGVSSVLIECHSYKFSIVSD